ncbi:MAG: 2-oxoglutarate and iron-dependent oxygenase domain-containing protein [Actinomycetota bacterium]
MNEILDVDLLAFESGTATERAAVVDGVMRSLVTGFVYTSHDLSTDLLDTAYAMLEEFFGLPIDDKQRAAVPGTNGQVGYTGLLVETAASSDTPDWKEMLNWGMGLPEGHPLSVRFPGAYAGPILPEEQVPGITKVLVSFYDRLLDLQRRFLRIIAVGIGCHETFFDTMTAHGTTLARAGP